jgi:tRNA-2-methylthio-N6-dimethylallyladenosine synthase
VPFTRGREVSRTPEDILDEVKRLVDDGAREVTFLGQNINTYGVDLGGQLLPDLLARASEIEGLDRLRFLTSNPFDMTEGMMRRFGEIPKVMPWLHIPAQSGADSMLLRMKRTYTVDQYREVVGWARTHIPGVEITSDFIVGFSGETEAEFQASCDLVREIGFLQTYIFKYSLRPRTHAARQLPDDIPEAVKRERNVELLRIQDETARVRNEHLVGKRLEILVEGLSKTDATRVTGRDRSHRLVHCDGTADLAGRMAIVQIEDIAAHSLIGRRVATEAADAPWTLRPAL